MIQVVQRRISYVWQKFFTPTSNTNIALGRWGNSGSESFIQDYDNCFHSKHTNIGSSNNYEHGGSCFKDSVNSYNCVKQKYKDLT